MTKHDVRSFKDLVRFSKQRAAGSLRRNDPWAMAYWKATLNFALQGLEVSPITDWVSIAKECIRLARAEVAAGSHVQAALWYSRAKWYVIMGRNNGVVMNPKVTGVNGSVFREISA